MPSPSHAEPTHEYLGFAGRYSVVLAPPKRGFADNVQQVTIVDLLEGKRTIPNGTTVAVLKSRVVQISGQEGKS